MESEESNPDWTSSIDPSHLLCPICLTLPEAEVYQCCIGHVFCKNCFEGFEILEGNWKKCPGKPGVAQCQQLLRDKHNLHRNLFFEARVDEFPWDCQFKSRGCPEKMIGRQKKKEHEDDCSFKIEDFDKRFYSCVDLFAKMRTDASGPSIPKSTNDFGAKKKRSRRNMSTQTDLNLIQISHAELDHLCDEVKDCVKAVARAEEAKNKMLALMEQIRSFQQRGRDVQDSVQIDLPGSIQVMLRMFFFLFVIILILGVASCIYISQVRPKLTD